MSIVAALWAGGMGEVYKARDTAVVFCHEEKHTSHRRWNRKVRGPPSGEPVAAVVARGEVEIGFQQVSELIHVPGVTFVGAIPAELQPGFSFAGAITSAARQLDAALALLRFLASPEAASTILEHGLTPPAGR